eukprot:TRINITY_DN15065_c0_g1_i3.p3 TRINITY_DN15065_c0_g1~~TRINITY_DN15065_c0_g1_i3.p3  ORF type:complete len:105 (+),score=8.62 TRINITY_DN15065_c0_g1_i3:490-804(+)
MPDRDQREVRTTGGDGVLAAAKKKIKRLRRRVVVAAAAAPAAAALVGILGFDVLPAPMRLQRRRGATPTSPSPASQGFAAPPPGSPRTRPASAAALLVPPCAVW